MRTREAYEAIELENLAPYAALSRTSRGRRYDEHEDPVRTAFQRDRDRVIHSAAFRRLEYKTQVFVNHEGDYYRTRLTHTLEGTQIARSIARALRVNEELAEAVSLAHDLGHTPFGHSGERALDDLMRDHGGFEHNVQSLRIVEVLEERYTGFPGLNLSWEVRDGIAKHSKRPDHPTIAQYDSSVSPCLEATIADMADEIAYNNHDIDDGITSGMLTFEQLAGVRLWRDAYAAVVERERKLEPHLVLYQVIRCIINWQVMDLIRATEENLRRLGVQSLDDVRATKEHVVTFGADMAELNAELKRFLKANLYDHHRVMRMSAKAQRFLRELFQAYCSDSRQLPPAVQRRMETEGLERAVADHIAGMTDRSALDEYKKLFDPYERV
ncbi:MAG: deoxyguanosinetriphosphate triphosphohydrolase [Deltaproteobacteria bacterium]|nr:deoxyguanosinetriphosphate triphosphohydrolase [Deltaproteobacteria bacterium]